MQPEHRDPSDPVIVPEVGIDFVSFGSFEPRQNPLDE